MRLAIFPNADAPPNLHSSETIDPQRWKLSTSPNPSFVPLVRIPKELITKNEVRRTKLSLEPSPGYITIAEGVPQTRLLERLKQEAAQKDLCCTRHAKDIEYEKRVAKFGNTYISKDTKVGDSRKQAKSTRPKKAAGKKSE
ncbi:hypothetical protein XU18_1864 [Perkinsela sp. CCAP 1560/4]|nr:hypothetical protein XU18_1864 [Perkinsela sp. CCAP 1560/4]|eukprot:KNH07332.1 hypothetical protein XU18_1864 [Perkinsela sp. CCAP 1560/4]